MFGKRTPRFDIESALSGLADKLDRIEARISFIALREKRIMSAIDDLNAVVTELAGHATNATATIADEVTKLKDALAKAAAVVPPDNSAAIEAAVAKIADVNKKLADAVASVAPAPVVAPAPAAAPVAPAPDPAAAPATPAAPASNTAPTA